MSNKQYSPPPKKQIELNVSLNNKNLYMTLSEHKLTIEVTILYNIHIRNMNLCVWKSSKSHHCPNLKDFATNSSSTNLAKKKKKKRVENRSDE